MEDITVWGHDGTPLHAAAKGNHAAVAQTLLGAGARVDGRDRYGWTALMRAAQRGHYAVAVVLLAHGANPNAQAREPRAAGARRWPRQESFSRGLVAVAVGQWHTNTRTRIRIRARAEA